MLDHNVPSSDYQILTAKRLQRDKVQAGYDVLSEYIQKNGVNFDTIITTSDLIAVGVLKCLRESNCRVPEDVQVVGYDDISIAALVSPPLTTIHQIRRAWVRKRLTCCARSCSPGTAIQAGGHREQAGHKGLHKKHASKELTR
jgi:DNA-binding LacI/PurR family transcriptional regulator